MSRCNDYTNWFVAMNKREQRGFTLAYVWLARKPNLTESERRTLITFKSVWFAGKDFRNERTFVFFLDMCKRHGVAIVVDKKPKHTGLKGAKGKMAPVEWTIEMDGWYWPALKNGDGTKREVVDLIRMKMEYRISALHKEMARLGIAELTYEFGNIDNRIEQAVDEKLREREPEPIQPEPAGTRAPAEWARLRLCLHHRYQCDGALMTRRFHGSTCRPIWSRPARTGPDAGRTVLGRTTGARCRLGGPAARTRTSTGPSLHHDRNSTTTKL
jgi:hypothetical protein